MGFKGSLDSINLADIFQNLAMNQQTGTLRVHDKDRVKCIYFQRGEVKYLSHGKRKNILLGEMLVGRGIATREQVEAALAEQKRSNRLLGEIVVELGIASREEVDNLVKFQIEEEIYDLFGWERGEFEFQEGPPPQDLFDPEQQATELSLNTSSLIMEAARRIDEWERIRQVVPSTREVFVPVAPTPPEGATPVAARLLSFMDGTRDLDGLVEDSCFSRFEVASTVAAMLEAGTVRPASVEELRAGAKRCLELDQPARAVRLLEKALALGADDPALRDEVAEACIRTGEKEKAAIHLGVLGDERAARGDFEGAIQAYDRILALLPRHPATHEKLAKLRASKGEKDKAIRHYASLVQGLIEAGKLEEAAAKCREGLALDAENVELRSALAKILASSGDKEAAIAEFERLGESLARARQIRPAAEAFRRILQLQPGNKHAKRRLEALLGGEGAARKSHAIRNVAIALLVAALGGGTYVVLHELAAQHQYDTAERESASLVEAGRFDDARAAWQPVLGNWSLSGYRALAEEHIQEIGRREKQAKEARAAEIRARQEAARKALEEGALAASSYDIERARAKLAEALSSEYAPDDVRSAAREKLAALEAEEKEVSAFLAWAAESEQRRDPESLQVEYARTLEMLSRYRKNPRLKDARLPLLIETDPPGAQVTVDRVVRGRTPLVVRYPAGSAPEIALALPGYVPVERVEIPRAPRVALELRRAVAWRVDVGSRVLSMAAGPNGSLLVANQDGVLSVIESPPGAPAGQRAVVRAFRTGEGLTGIGSGITLEGATVYFGTDQLYSLDLGAGVQRRWATGVGGKVLAPPVVGRVGLVGGREFVFGTSVDARGSGTVWALDASNGSVVWRAAPSELRAATRSRPLFMDPRLFVAFDDGRVYALQATDGKVLGTWAVCAPAGLGSPVWDGTVAWIASAGLEGGLHALDLEAPGRPVRSYRARFPVVAEIQLARGVAYLGEERAGKGAVEAVDLKTFDSLWLYTAAEGRISGSLAVSESRVYFGTTQGWVYALDRSSGKLVWKYRTGDEVSGGVLFDGSWLCVGSSDGYVYAFAEGRASGQGEDAAARGP